MSRPSTAERTRPPRARPQVSRGRAQHSGARVPAPVGASPGPRRLLDNWLNIQAVNLDRHTRSLRPFTKDEFGTGPAAPSEAHIDAVNRFIGDLRSTLTEAARWVEAATAAAIREPTPERLQTVLDRKQEVSNRVLYVEGIWDFYFDIFVQRLSTFGERLRAVDRISTSCYEKTYVGLGTATPTPALLPFSYASSGFSPATYRRGVPMRRLRHHRNLFPLVMLPQHRLDAVWALSSVLHEVSHNLQADLGLWDVMPKLILSRLTQEGVPAEVARTWAAWHKETMADVLALLLGGPAAVESLMDVVGRSRAATVRFAPGAVHPTPYLRVLISLHLLERLGCDALAADLRKVWRCLYPKVGPSDIPEPVLQTFDAACASVVDTMAFRRHDQLAGKALTQMIEFGPPQMAAIEEAGRRLGAGDDAGSIPPRLMVSAARFAIDNRLASPQNITENFYRVLGRR